MYFGSSKDWETNLAVFVFFFGLVAMLGSIGYGIYWVFSHIYWR